MSHYTSNLKCLFSFGDRLLNSWPYGETRPARRTGEDRLAGYLQAHADHGLEVFPYLMLAGRFDQATARDSTLARMQAPGPPTAIFALSNMMMLGVLNALRTLDRSVPGDVSVIGIDDFDFANIMNPPPTVVAAPVTDMAQSAIAALLEEIGRKHADRPTHCFCATADRANPAGL